MEAVRRSTNSETDKMLWCGQVLCSAFHYFWSTFYYSVIQYSCAKFLLLSHLFLNWFSSVLWHFWYCWFGYLSCKTIPYKRPIMCRVGRQTFTHSLYSFSQVFSSNCTTERLYFEMVSMAGQTDWQRGCDTGDAYTIYRDDDIVPLNDCRMLVNVSEHDADGMWIRAMTRHTYRMTQTHRNADTTTYDDYFRSWPQYWRLANRTAIESTQILSFTQFLRPQWWRTKLGPDDAEAYSCVATTTNDDVWYLLQYGVRYAGDVSQCTRLQFSEESCS